MQVIISLLVTTQIMTGYSPYGITDALIESYK